MERPSIVTIIYFSAWQTQYEGYIDKTIRQIDQELRAAQKTHASAKPVDFELAYALDMADEEFNRIHHHNQELLATTEKLSKREIQELNQQREKYESTFISTDDGLIDDKYINEVKLQNSEPASFQEKKLNERQTLLAAVHSNSDLIYRPYQEICKKHLKYSSFEDYLVDFSLLTQIEAGGCSEIGLTFENESEIEKANYLEYNSKIQKTLEQLETEFMCESSEQSVRQTPRVEPNEVVLAKFKNFFKLGAFCCELVNKTVNLKHFDKYDYKLQISEQQRMFANQFKYYKNVPALRNRK